MNSNQVAIIGAGVSGLVTAKVLQGDGFDVSIFEKAPEVGGVWETSRAYPGLRTNSPYPLYAFSDFDHSESTDEFPTAGQIRGYLERYADHFGLRDHLNLETEVVSVKQLPSEEEGQHPGFQVHTRDLTTGGPIRSRTFDFVVVCNGVLSEPHIPDFDGSRDFAGTILHSSQVQHADSLVGKRVLVIGAGKSALDCATLAGQVSDSCTLLFRKTYWMLPRYYGRTRVDKLIYSRWVEKLSYPPYHQSPLPEKLLRGLCTPLVSLFRRKQRQFTIRATRMPGFMVPDMSIHDSIFHLGIGSDIYNHINSGQVHAMRSEIERFTGGHGIRLTNGEDMEADVVICATGWKRNVDFLDRPLRETLAPNGQLRLYRHILPPTEQRLGFVGYASSTNSPLTSEIAAHWLSQHFLGKLRLPNTRAMERSVDRVLKWTARHFPQQWEGHFIGGYVAHYTDWLLRDMEVRQRRCPGLASEHLQPFRANRLRGLERERSHVSVDTGARGGAG